MIRGFDPGYNYAMFLDPNLTLNRYDFRKFQALARMLNLPIPTNKTEVTELLKMPFVQQLPQLFSKAIESFQKNKLLQQLGTAYMRQKIVVEKLTALAKTGNDATFQRLMEHDRFAVDLQTMIFHFMNEAYANYLDRLKAAETEQQRESAGEFLATVVPTFARYPYYQGIISRLEGLAEPMVIE